VKPRRTRRARRKEQRKQDRETTRKVLLLSSSPLRITTSSNLVFLRKFWKGWHVSQENQKSYVSRRGAGQERRLWFFDLCASASLREKVLVAAERSEAAPCSSWFQAFGGGRRPRWAGRGPANIPDARVLAYRAQSRYVGCLDSRLRGNDKVADGPRLPRASRRRAGRGRPGRRLC
jgi:hypothetical protein